MQFPVVIDLIMMTAATPNIVGLSVGVAFAATVGLLLVIVAIVYLQYKARNKRLFE